MNAFGPLTILASLLPTALAPAQGPVPSEPVERGITAAWPTAMILNNELQTDSVIMFKTAGTQGTTVSIVPTGGSPDFSMAALKPVVLAAITPPAGGGERYLTMDGISSGNGQQPIRHETGPDRFEHLDAALQWATLTFSVTPDAAGTPNSYLHNLNQQNINPGFEVLGVYSTSSGVFNGLSGSTQLEVSRTDVTSLPSDADIQAFDAFMPMIVLNGAPQGPIIPVVDKFYFTVTSACAAQLGTLGSQQIYGATVLGLTWAGGAWTNLEIIAQPADLGLLVSDDIDGLDVGPLPHLPTSPSPTNVVDMVGSEFEPIITFSVVANGLQDQVMVSAMVDNGNGPTRKNGTLHRNGNGGVGPKVVGNAGLAGEDDLDSICNYDPEALASVKCLGMPVSENLLTVVDTTYGLHNGEWRPSKQTGLSAHRLDVGNQGNLRCVLSGWGSVQPQLCVGVAVLGFGNTHPHIQIPIPIIRQADQNWTQFELPTAALGDLTIGVKTFSDTGTELFRSYLLKIRL